MAYGNGGAALAGGYAVGAMGQAKLNEAMTPPQRAALIPEQLLGLEKRLEEAHCLISSLENRLSGVLQPEPPAATAATDGADHPPFAIGAALAEANYRLSNALRRLQSMLDRCEL